MSPSLAAEAPRLNDESHGQYLSMSSTEAVRAAANHVRRRRLSLLWFAVTIGWTLIRAAAVHAGLSEYGVNVWVFLVIDLLSAVADGYATPKAVLALVDNQISTAFKWLAVFLVAFVVPDIYVFAAGDHVPRRAYLVLAVIVTITSTVAVIAFVKRVRAARVCRERAVRTSGFVEALESTVALRAPINSSLNIKTSPGESSNEHA